MKRIYILVFIIIFPILFFGVIKIIGYKIENEAMIKLVNELENIGVNNEIIMNETDTRPILNAMPTVEPTMIPTAIPTAIPMVIPTIIPTVTPATVLLSTNEIKKIIKNGTDWMKNAQEENGHFKYEYYPVSGLFSDDDNMVRQTGAFFVLGEILKRDSENKYELKNTIERAISYFEKNSYAGNFNGQKFRCILRSSKICSLGATSLALIGIVDLVETYPEMISEHGRLLNDYLGFILAMKKDNGGFRGNFYLDNEQSEKESDFSSGEAFLALAKYYEYKPTKEIKEVIDNSYDYFENKYSENPNNNFYLWGMAGVKELYQLEPDVKYYNFVKDYTDWRIKFYKGLRDKTRNKCAYIEGVISAYSVLKPNLETSEKSYYEEEIEFWLNKTRDLQIGNETVLIVKVGDNEMRMAIINSDIAFGGFLTGTSIDHISQRIDFTQHCLSSYLQKLVDIDGVSL